MARTVLLPALTVAVIAMLVGGFYVYTSATGAKQSSVFETNTYLTNCVITGVGGFEFRVVSSSTEATIIGDTIMAIDRVGCNAEHQVVYLDSFSQSRGGGGWLVPNWPSQATQAGQLSFTVSYQGGIYNFTTNIPPVGTNCVTLFVPSGNMNSTTVMNGSGSYCP